MMPDDCYHRTRSKFELMDGRLTSKSLEEYNRPRLAEYILHLRREIQIRDEIIEHLIDKKGTYDKPRTLQK